LIDKIRKLYHLLVEFFSVEIIYFSASLSFYTIFAIIPILLIFFSLFTKLPAFSEYYESLRDFIFSNLMPTNTEAITNYINEFLANSDSLGVMGLVSVIITSLMFFNNYEYIVNKIFGSKERGFWDSISTYWTLITLTPIGLILSFYLSNQIQELLNSTTYTSSIDFISILPYLIVWGIFFITYKISANITINLKSAMISSFISSLSWYISKNLFIQYIFYNKTYSTIYGSFSVIIFLFLWIYFSWMIFLYGIKLCSILNKKDVNHG